MGSTCVTAAVNSSTFLSIMDLKGYYLQLFYPTIAYSSTLNWISNYSIYQILDVKLDALDGDFLQQQQAATGDKKMTPNGV